MYNLSAERMFMWGGDKRKEISFPQFIHVPAVNCGKDVSTSFFLLSNLSAIQNEAFVQVYFLPCNKRNNICRVLLPLPLLLNYTTA